MRRLMWLDESRRQHVQEQLQSAMQHWLANWSFLPAVCQVEEQRTIQPANVEYFSDTGDVLLAVSGSNESLVKYWMFGDGEPLVPNDAILEQLIDQAADELRHALISPFISVHQLKMTGADVSVLADGSDAATTALWFRVLVSGKSIFVGLSADLLLHSGKKSQTNPLSSRSQAVGDESLRVEVKVNLCQVPVTQVLNLQCGDVITSGIKLNQPLSVFVDNNEVLHGYLGSANAQKALSLVSLKK